MANFFVPKGSDPSRYSMTYDPKGSGSEKPFLHPWKVTVAEGDSISLGLYGGYDNRIPLTLASNKPGIISLSEVVPIFPADRDINIDGKEEGFTIIDALSKASGTKPWCSIQVEVKREYHPKSRGSISPLGTMAFMMEYLSAFHFLIRSPSAHKLVSEAIPSTGKRLFIRRSPIDTSTADPVSLDAAMLNSDGTPGPGSNVIIRFNTNPQFAVKQSGDSDPMAVAMALGHELVHAWYAMSGTAERGPGRREHQAVGLQKYAEAEFSENRFRTELGAHPRLVY